MKKVGLVLRRLVAVGLSSALTVAALVGLFSWLALSVNWRIPDPAALTAPTTVYDRDGVVLARFTSEVDRRVVGIDEVSEIARLAILASEDARFYEHRGVDPISLLRAVFRNVSTGRIEQGGSTLTQQYVKNAFVGDDRNIIRKVREAVISIQLERDNPDKNVILEKYLNTVYFGEGAYGIEAAALTYFGIHASELTAAHGATLAQLLPGPSRRNPRADPEGALERRNRVLLQMSQQGKLSPAAYEEAVASEMVIEPRQAQLVTYPHFVSYVRRQLEVAYGGQAVLTGGLQVTTTIDSASQGALEQAVLDQLPAQEYDGDPADCPDDPLCNLDVDAGAVAIHPATGDILALYGGRDFSVSEFDLGTQGRRQSGSTFKPLVFMSALEQGVLEDDLVPAPGKINITSCGDENWEVSNAGGTNYGRMTIREGLINSVNTVFAPLGCRVGPDAIVDIARRAGASSPLEPVRTIALGAPPLGPTVLDVTSIYATIANDGLYCPARSILRVLDPDGRRMPLPDEVTIVPGEEPRTRALTPEELEARDEELAKRDRARCTGAIDQTITRVTTQALTEVVERTTGRRAQIGRPQAGKTGTTNEERDAWFAGFTPDLAMAVWVGHAVDATKSIRNIEGFRRVQGGTIPALIWHDAALAMLDEVPHSEFLLPGEEGTRRARRPGPEITPEPAPSPSPTPSASASPSPSPSPSQEPSPDEDDDDGIGPIDPQPGPTGGTCVPILQECEDPAPG